MRKLFRKKRREIELPDTVTLTLCPACRGEKVCPVCGGKPWWSAAAGSWIVGCSSCWGEHTGACQECKGRGWL